MHQMKPDLPALVCVPLVRQCSSKGCRMREEPWKRLRRFEQARQFHELTFSCFQRWPLLTEPNRCTALSASLDRACDEEDFALVAYVFMPEHVHLLVLPRSAEARVSRFLARTKQRASSEIRRQLAASDPRLLARLIVQERPGRPCFRFWQPGSGYDRNLFSPQAIAASIDYIHRNPVRRGLCERAIDYDWSSARL